MIENMILIFENENEISGLSIERIFLATQWDPIATRNCVDF